MTENIDDISNKNMSALITIGNAISNIGDTIGEIFGSDQIRDTISVISAFAKKVSDVVSSDYMKSVRESFAIFGKAIEEAYNNPNSILNYYEYQERLEQFHWAWPFNILPEELKVLVEQANDEKSFDKLIASFFTEDRIQQMLSYIEGEIPRKHKLIFKQIEKAYIEKHFALVNNAVLSIIDNILTLVLDDKGCVARKGILHPIIEFYSGNFEIKEIGFIFEFCMLSNSIDLIFRNYDFSKRIKVNSNKRAFRHLAIHGFMYSNKKIDTIMLLNTLAALLLNINYIIPFKNVIKRVGKKFVLKCRSYVVTNRIKKKLVVFNSCDG